MLWVSYPGGERGINYVDPLKGLPQSKANRFARMRFILVQHFEPVRMGPNEKAQH